MLFGMDTVSINWEFIGTLFFVGYALGILMGIFMGIFISTPSTNNSEKEEKEGH